MIFLAVLLGAVSCLEQPTGLLQSALTNPAVFTALFSEYESGQDRHYLSSERRLRAGIFRQSLKEVVAHNAAGDDWAAELNMFSDMTQEEKASYTGFNASEVVDSVNAVEDVAPAFLANPTCKLDYITFADYQSL